MSTQIDYYELLEIERGADAGTIKSSYRKLAMKFHPDKNAGCKESEARFKAVSEAYDCLKDPQKRAAYDRFRPCRLPEWRRRRGMAGRRISQAFPTFSKACSASSWAGAPAAGSRRGAARTCATTWKSRSTRRSTARILRSRSTCRHRATPATDRARGPAPMLMPATPAAGMARCGRNRAVFVVVERACPVCSGSGQVIEDPCPDCRGDGRVERTKTLNVNVPPGVDEGTRIRLSGEGEAGRPRRPGGRSLHLPSCEASRGVRARGH